MIKNYFVLNRLAIELDELLSGAKPVSIFTQEKDRVVIEFRNQNQTAFVEFCVNPTLPFILLKNDFRRAKKNTIDLFPQLIDTKLNSVMMCSTDRIIRFEFDSAAMYFIVRGKLTNLIFISKTENDSFKKTESEFFPEFQDELSTYNFIRGFNQPDFSEVEKNISQENFRKQFPFISKEILLESKLTSGKEFDLNAIQNTIRGMENDRIVVVSDSNSGNIKLTFESFKQFDSDEKTFYNSVNEAFKFYLPEKYKLEKLLSHERIVKKHIDALAIRYSQKLNKLKSVLDRKSNEEEYKQLADLLLVNINQIKEGMTEITLNDFYSENKTVTIKLDQSKSPKKNIDSYFEKARSEKLNREKSLELFEKTQKEFFRINKLSSEIESGISSERINEIMSELKIKSNTQTDDKDDIRTKFKRYVIDQKYFVYVGRDSKNNDLLTLKFAKQNDYWFHARSVPGSHVVLKSDTSKENMPKDVIKRAASIAAFHSKAKTSGIVQVSFTQKKYVVKKKGMEAGKVALLREQVVNVKPEIPKGCEFIDSNQE
ncbi:MAG: DUF814 domain-containing protein [Ignavibacteriales bacterium]|nr:MAG: DUF814 domain-containing protein [Ignavibacteriales bacterium]